MRLSTSNDACLVEAGYPSLEAAIRYRQQKFLKLMIEERKDMVDDPLMFALELTAKDNRVTNRYIQDVLNEEGDIIENDMRKRKDKIRSSPRTKLRTYCLVNPDLSVHPIYTSDEIVDDDYRIAFTRLRLSSHRLRIETGRWARIPQERRICHCGRAVQTEQHVLCDCTLVAHIRTAFSSPVTRSCRVQRRSSNWLWLCKF